MGRNTTRRNEYIKLKRNEEYYNSDEFYTMLDEAIIEYNKAINENNLEAKSKWQELILRKLIDKSTNSIMIKQYNTHNFKEVNRKLYEI